MTIDQILDEMGDEKKSAAKGLGAGAAGAATVGGFLDPTKLNDLAAGRYSFAIRHKNDTKPVPGAAKDIPERTLHSRRIVAVNEPGLRITPEMAKKYGFIRSITGIPPDVHEKIARSLAAHLPVEDLKRLVPPSAFLDMKDTRINRVVSAPNLSKASPELDEIKLDILQNFPGRKDKTAGEYYPRRAHAWAEVQPLSSAEAAAGTPQHEVRGHGADDVADLLRSKDEDLQALIDQLSQGNGKLRDRLEHLAYMHQSDETAARAVEKGYMDPVALRQGKHIESELAYDAADPKSKGNIIAKLKDAAMRWNAGAADLPRMSENQYYDTGREVLREAVRSSQEKGIMGATENLRLEGPSMTDQMEALTKAGVKRPRAWDAIRSAFALDAAEAQGVRVGTQAAEHGGQARSLIKAVMQRIGSKKTLEEMLQIAKAIK